MVAYISTSDTVDTAALWQFRELTTTQKRMKELPVGNKAIRRKNLIGPLLVIVGFLGFIGLGIARVGHGGVAVGPILLVMGGLVLRWFWQAKPAVRELQQIRAPFAYEELAHDQRPAIVLLRSFEQEQLKLATSLFYSTRIEEVVVSSIKRFGPVIAIGSPEDELPQLGAARAYVPRNDEWTRIALEWIHSARMIVLFAGRTTGLLWELGRIIQHGYLNKTIVLCSHNSASDRQIWHNNSEADGSYLFAVQIADAIGRGDVITQSNLDDVIAMFVGRHQELVFVRTPNFSADAYEKAIEQWVLEVFCTQRECAPPH